MERQHSDKIVLLTGARGTIGQAVAYKLAGSGAGLRLVYSNRHEAAESIAKENVEKLIAKTGNPNIKPLFADMSSLQSIKKMVADYLESTAEPLHVLINNAAVFGLGKRIESAEGHEMTFAVNFLGPYALTLLLLERLEGSGAGRIVNVASEEYTDLKDFEQSISNYDAQHHYSLHQYAFSKLSLILFSRALARRLQATSITVNAMHPGAVPSNMWNNLPFRLQLKISLFRYLAPLLKPGIIITPEETAKTYLYLALSPEMEKVSSRYFYREQEVPLNAMALNDDYAERIWELGSELTKVNFPQNL